MNEIQHYPHAMYRGTDDRWPEWPNSDPRGKYFRHRGVALLYRAANDEAEFVTGMKEGWHPSLDDAVDQFNRDLLVRAPLRFVVKHWQYVITTTVAVASAVASVASASIALMIFEAAKTPPVPAASLSVSSAQIQGVAGSKFAQMLAAGFAPHEIDEWEASERAKLRAEGVNEADIHRYFVDANAARPHALSWVNGSRAPASAADRDHPLETVGK